MTAFRQRLFSYAVAARARILRADGRGVFAQFVRDRRAVSAVEFALLLPLMLVLYIGGNEVGQSIAIYRKVAQTAYTMCDLITQVSSTTSAGVTDVLAAANAVMMPYDASGAKMVLAAVTYNGGTYQVAWSKAQNGATAWTVGAAPPSTITIPTNLVTTGQQLIVAQVTYTYTSVFTSVMTKIWGSNSITMGDAVFLRPRLSSTIGCPDC
jgi:Flp pilus assembly protein TadG